MASTEVLKDEYDVAGVDYEDIIASTPLGIIEGQLLASAFGTDCTVYKKALDLGGGSGLRARQLLELGAGCVDVVDLSPEMMRFGEAEARKQNYGEDRIRFYEADVSKPLDHLPALRKESYDLVMANWVMDHAPSVADLEGIWANVAAYLKPGGRYVGTRGGDPYAPSARTFKYGTRYKDHQPIPGGIRYRYMTNTTPVIDIEASSMEVSYSGSTELHTKYGLTDVEIEPFENAEVVRKDPEFWELYTQDPHCVVVKARKKEQAEE